MNNRLIGTILMITFLSIAFVVNGAGVDLSHQTHTGQKNIKQLPETILKLREAKQAGQSTFAAIAEIVNILNENPDTNWETVNIDRLRNHLVDMNELTLYAQATYSKDKKKSIFMITGTAKVLRAIKNMVIAHAKELNKIQGWKVTTQSYAQGVKLIIETDIKNDLKKIKALGFFGLMATGAHHQSHHVAMAIGKMNDH